MLLAMMLDLAEPSGGRWGSVPWGAVLSGVILLWGVLMAAFTERLSRLFVRRTDVYGPDGRPLFATREDCNGIGARVTAAMDLYVRLEDRTGAMEEAVVGLKTKSEAQWERISERMAETAKTLERVTMQLESVSREQARMDGERSSERRQQGGGAR